MSLLTHLLDAKERWPELEWNEKIKEAHSSCPFCNDGEDRFMIFESGLYFCRQCESKGVIRTDEEENKLDETQKRLLKLEREQKRAERERQDLQRRMTALERMAKCTDHLTYHGNLSMQAIEYWLSQGMTNDSIDKYKLGYCDRCPTDRNCRPSYTIPVTYRNRLLNIRHRLVGCDSDKYRPHIPGLGVQLFNADNVHRKMPEIIITEGEKKSIICEQEGFPNVGIIGKSGFRDEWVPYFGRFRQVNVLLDPDATESATRLAAQFGGRGRVVTLPVKSDDFFHVYGGTKEDLLGFIKQAKPNSIRPV